MVQKGVIPRLVKKIVIKPKCRGVISKKTLYNLKRWFKKEFKNNLGGAKRSGFVVDAKNRSNADKQRV